MSSYVYDVSHVPPVDMGKLLTKARRELMQQAGVNVFWTLKHDARRNQVHLQSEQLAKCKEALDAILADKRYYDVQYASIA